MALQSHAVHSPAGLGIDEATREELVEFGTANLAAENVRQDARGDMSKRPGFALMSDTTLGGGSQNGGGFGVFTDGTTPTRIVKDLGRYRAEAYDAVSGQWARLLGALPECTQRIIDLPSPNNTATVQDIATANGYIAISWYTLAASGTVTSFAALVNATTGAVVSPPTVVGSATALTAPLLVAVGSFFILLRQDAAANMKAWYLNTTNGAGIVAGWVAMTDLATDVKFVGGVSPFAVLSLPHATLARAAVAYVNNSGGASLVTVKTFTQAGVLETQAINTSSVAPEAVDLAGTATGTLWVGWNEATAVKVRGLSPLAITTTALASTATIVTAVTGVTDIALLAHSITGTGRMIVNSSSTTMQVHMRRFATTAGAAVTSGSQWTVYAARTAGKPWQVGDYDICYVPITGADSSNEQKNVVVVDWTDAGNTFFRPVACPAPGLSTAPAYPNPKGAAVAVGDKVYFPLSVARSSVAQGSALVELDYANTRRFRTCAWGNSVYMGGGVSYCLDGVRAAECGFLFRPTTPTTTTGGAGISATTGWRYLAVYEEVDGDGNWNQSGLSNPSASTGAVVNKTVTVSTTTLTTSGRILAAGASSAGTRVAWYRTLDGGVAPYYRLGTTLNDTAAATVTFADTTSDATLAANAKLYSQPGVIGTAQDKRPPPGLVSLVAFNGMLVGASGSDVWSSGQPVSGEGAWFNPIFQTPVPGDGDITALAVMDGTLFAFKRREVYAISGEPPSDNAASGGLGTPRRLAVDVGCIEARSTCTTAFGIFFQSARGIEILTRAQSVEWIGEAVQDTLASYPVVTSATVDPVSSTVRVECAAAESSGLVSGNGRSLVYDLSLKTWVSIDRRVATNGFFSTSDAPSQAAAMLYVSGSWRYAWLSAAGFVHYESASTWLDADGSFVTSRYETANAKHGLQQEQRIWSGKILFERHSAAGLKVEVAYDYAAYSAANDKVWTEAETLGQRQLEWRPKSRGQAMKFRVSDTAPAVLGTGRGFTFIGTSLDMAPKQGSTTGTVRLDPSLRK